MNTPTLRRFLVLCAATISIAGVAAPTFADPPAKNAGEASLVLRNGNFFKGNIGVKQFEVETRYGKLVVPAGDVTRIRIGKQSDPEGKARIDKLVADLGSKEFRAREEAQKELAKLGAAAYTEIEAASRSTDLEISQRAAALLADITVDEDDVQPVDDEVVTATFVIRGTLKLDALNVVTDFGTLKIEKKNINTLTMNAPDGLSKNVSITANDTVQTQWRDTGVKLKKGERLSVRATGSVNWGGRGYATVPKGNSEIGHYTNIGSQPVYYGALLGRIGQNGQMFYIGEKYNGTMQQDGNLFICIAVQWTDNQASGEYKVTIETRPRSLLGDDPK